MIVLPGEALTDVDGELDTDGSGVDDDVAPAEMEAENEDDTQPDTLADAEEQCDGSEDIEAVTENIGVSDTDGDEDCVLRYIVPVGDLGADMEGEPLVEAVAQRETFDDEVRDAVCDVDTVLLVDGVEMTE